MQRRLDLLGGQQQRHTHWCHGDALVHFMASYSGFRLSNVSQWGCSRLHSDARARLVYIEGRLQSRQWQATDGTTRPTVEIIANRLQALSKSASEAPAA